MDPSGSSSSFSHMEVSFCAYLLPISMFQSSRGIVGPDENSPITCVTPVFSTSDPSPGGVGPTDVFGNYLVVQPRSP